ncbi:MAG: hypothetical protein J6N54_04170 [Bacteroidales bacterium]|nr:hypothetical protein [Bacteroidales bacterium]
MFAWENPITGYESDKVDPANYTYEGDGLHLAFMEAYADLADIDIMFATVSTQGTNTYAKAYNQGGQQAAMEAVTAFKGEPVFEGFLADVKKKIISLLTKLKEKIKAFFHSAVQYFDAFFKNGAQFAEKYEEELRDKDDLDDFKYKMYKWDGLKDLNFKSDWADMKNKAVKAAKDNGVVLMEAYGMDSSNWIDAVWAIAMEEAGVAYRKKNDGTIKIVSAGSPADKMLKGTGKVWKKIDSSADVNLLHVKYNAKGDPDDEEEASAAARARNTPAELKSVTASQKKLIIAAAIKALDGESEKIDKFKEKLKKKLRGGPEARPIKPDIDKIIDILKDTDATDKIKEAGDELLEAIDDQIDNAKDADKSGDEAKKVKNSVTVFTICKDVYMAYFNVYKACLEERENQYKGCLSAALHYHGKKD